MTTATTRRRGVTSRRRGGRDGPSAGRTGARAGARAGAGAGAGGRAARDGDGGMVTAELAAALPALAVVLVLAVYVVAVAAAQLRVSDAAREAARALARGDDRATVLAVAGRVAPAGARVRLSEGAGIVEVDVVATLPAPGPLAGVLPATSVSGEAVAVKESR